jgi:hypothetical protein
MLAWSISSAWASFPANSARGGGKYEGFADALNFGSPGHQAGALASLSRCQPEKKGTDAS